MAMRIVESRKVRNGKELCSLSVYTNEKNAMGIKNKEN